MCTIKLKDGILTSVRIKKGFSMSEFAKKLETTPGAISKLENGLVSPRPKTAQKICEALNVSFDDLFEIVVN